MSRGAARTGIDTAGGTILGVNAPTVFVNDQPVAVVGDPVAGHGKPPHASAVMAEGSPNVFAEDLPVCRQGDAASCGDTATGSDNVFVN